MGCFFPFQKNKVNSAAEFISETRRSDGHYTKEKFEKHFEAASLSAQRGMHTCILIIGRSIPEHWLKNSPS